MTPRIKRVTALLKVAQHATTVVRLVTCRASAPSQQRTSRATTVAIPATFHVTAQTLSNSSSRAAVAASAELLAAALDRSAISAVKWVTSPATAPKVVVATVVDAEVMVVVVAGTAVEDMAAAAVAATAVALAAR